MQHLPPLASNPGSNEGAKSNLRHLGQIMGLRQFVPPSEVQRNNLIIYEDGGGFIPTLKAIENCFLDPFCSIKFDDKNQFMSHLISEHGDVSIADVNNFTEFKDCHVELGGGHYEENCRRNCLNDGINFRVKG
jgi:hypothetical protein